MKVKPVVIPEVKTVIDTVGRDRARGRDGDRGRRARPAARHHPRVPGARLRVAFLPKAATRLRRRGRARSTPRRGRDHRRGADSRQESGDGIVLDVSRREGHAPGGRAPVSLEQEVEVDDAKELAIATSTVWVVSRASSSCSCKARFALLEAGLTRMKKVGHIAAKGGSSWRSPRSSTTSSAWDRVRRRRQRVVGGSGFLPSVDTCSPSAPRRSLGSPRCPRRRRLPLRGRVRAVSLAIVWGAMAERTRLWVYFVFGVAFVLVYSIVSHWIWSPDGWLFGLRMQDFAGSTVVHYRGPSPSSPAILRIRKFGADGKPRPIQATTWPSSRSGYHPLVRLVRFQRRSRHTASSARSAISRTSRSIRNLARRRVLGRS